MRTVLIAGATGAVAEGIVRRFLTQGWHVVALSRDASKLAELQGRFSDTPLSVFVTDWSGDPLALVRAQFDRFDAAVVSVGGWWQGANLVDVDPEVLNRLWLNNVMTHVRLTQSLWPLLLGAEGGASLSFIGGSAGEDPVAGAGPASIASAAQIMFVRGLGEESRESTVRVNELILGPVATRRVSDPDVSWITSDDVGFVFEAIASGTARGQVVRLYDKAMFAGVVGSL